MGFIEAMRERVEHLATFAALDSPGPQLPTAVLALDDDALRSAVAEVADLARTVTTLQAALAGAVARRSPRTGPGIARDGGFRNPVEMIRAVGGVSKAEATRAVQVGESLMDAADVADDPDTDAGDEPAGEIPIWHRPLDEALLAGQITAAQHQAIRRGLDVPPSDEESVLAAWRAAATELLGEAGVWTVEELERNARTLRDMLDPEGALARFQERFEKRSAILTAGGAGPRKLIMVLDDEIAAWVQHLFDSALRPRRGGPRFMTDEERAAAEDLVDDPRTNEQLAYDLLIDVLRAGARAEAKDVFGARAPGVRLVATVGDVAGGDVGGGGAGAGDRAGRTRRAGDGSQGAGRDGSDGAGRDGAGSDGAGSDGAGSDGAGRRVRRTGFGSLIAVATTEDYGLAMSGAILEVALCETGAVEVAVDCAGNPLSLGRTQRTYTAQQKLALAVRDGGCMWPGCDRPPSYCEAHHCVPWEEGGETDCKLGVLLCRYHHLLLHNQGWRITRDDDLGAFWLHTPQGSGREPVMLKSKSPLRYLWDPPPARASWRTSPAPAAAPVEPHPSA